MKAHPLLLLSLVVLIAFSLAGPAAAQGPVLDPARSPSPPVSRGLGPQQDRDGLWFMPVSHVWPAAQAAAPANSGGPDDFGYTWTDIAPNWIDAGGGTDTGITMSTSGAGPLDIGFPFKFYETTRTQLWVSRYGYLAVSDSTWRSQSQIPSASAPNDVIAPHWAPNYGSMNYVRYLRGGSAPNRWFAVEWNNMRSDCCSDGQEEYTFEVILRENGDIVFQYGNMLTVGNYSCQVSGIEDSTGLDGLRVTPFCQPVQPNHAVKIARPPASVWVTLFPRAQGQFGTPGGTVTFAQTVRNTGELGVDTYDLWLEADGQWPTSLYWADGVTPLTDTDGDGQPDTGPINQGSSTDIVVKVALPAGATVGDRSSPGVTAISSRNPTKLKTARYQVGVPASFASSYAQSGKPTLGYHRPGGQQTRQTADGSASGYDAAAATLPDGRIVQVWSQGRDLGSSRWVNELYYALTDNKGQVLRPAARLTDLSSATGNAYDSSPSVAVSPDGHIGVAWYRELSRNGYNEYNYNIYHLVLDSNGNMAVQPRNLTNNQVWFSWSGNTRFEVYDAVIASTGSNRFGVAWTRYTANGSQSADTTWYTVRGADGSEVRAPGQVSAGTQSWYPNLTSLADGTIFLVQMSAGELSFARIDGAGNQVTPLTPTGVKNISAPDAVQLQNGNIVITWTTGYVGYLVLNSSLQVVRGASSLPKISPTYDYYVSVTRSGDRAVLTWGDDCCDFQPNLYYALLDGSGSVITEPMIFFSDYANYDVNLPSNGQGNTPLIGDTTPPANPTALASPSHEVNVWSRDTTVDLTWNAAVDDDTGVAGYSVLWDHSANSTPDAVTDIGAVTAATGPALGDGGWYVHVRAVDGAGNWASGAAHAGPFKIDTTAPKCDAYSPAYSVGPIPVTWGGADAGSGIATYDIWAASEMNGGPWSKWLADTTSTSAAYSAPVGDVVHFQCAATDAVGNVEVEGFNVEWSQTRVAARAASGRVTNIRGEGVFNAGIWPHAGFGVLGGGRSDLRGQYTLFFGAESERFITLSADRAGFGALAPRAGVDTEATPSDMDFVLPPSLDLVTNGQFEAGDLSAWQAWMPSDEYTATATSTAAHSGSYGLHIVTSAPGGILPIAILEQSVQIPADMRAPTLSFWYKSAGPAEGSVSFSGYSGPWLTLPTEGWKHGWLDLSEYKGKTFNLFILLSNRTKLDVSIDEISVGDAAPGSYPIFLPRLQR